MKYTFAVKSEENTYRECQLRCCDVVGRHVFTGLWNWSGLVDRLAGKPGTITFYNHFYYFCTLSGEKKSDEKYCNVWQIRPLYG